MPLIFDARNFTERHREELAWKIHEAHDWQLPPLRYWNSSPCRVHARGWAETVTVDGVPKEHIVYGRPKPKCRDCGVVFTSHQRLGIAWLYLKKFGLLGDTMGLGKTVTAAGLIALLAETGELSLTRDRSNNLFGGKGRVMIIPRTSALHHWRRELTRVIPQLTTILVEGTKPNRVKQYLQPWQIMLIGPEMFRNDYEMLEKFDFSLVLTDDLDALRNPDTNTAYAVNRLGARGITGSRPGTDRFVIMSGTPLQKRLPELHAILSGLGGVRVLGDRKPFLSRHVRYASSADSKRPVIVGYQGLDRIKSAISPLVLRRTDRDVSDVDLPAIVPNEVFLDLYPAQRRKYEELRKGVVRLIKEQGEQIKRPDALAKLHYGASICAGLHTLGEADGPGMSAKLDWTLDMINGELQDEKVVVFANLRSTIRALQIRLGNHEIGAVTIWGEEKDKALRDRAQERFWTDPKCRVLLGTRAIEQSLNLQVARHLINVDTILNPARMEQLAGRVRRIGSAYERVFVHTLLSVDTQEERYLPLLERESALAAHIWDEESQLFDTTTALALLQMIAS